MRCLYRINICLRTWADAGLGRGRSKKSQTVWWGARVRASPFCVSPRWAPMARPSRPAYPNGWGPRAGQLRQALMEPTAGQQGLGRSSVCLPHRPFIFGHLPAASPLATSCLFPSPSSQAQLLKCPQISCLSFLWSLSNILPANLVSFLMVQIGRHLF